MNKDFMLEQVRENRKNGYNCCQAVVCAFKDRYDMDESLILKVSEGFGGGMAIQSVCGAVTAMVILAGLENADGDAEKPSTKKDTYKVVKELQKKFEEKNQSLICSELKGIETKKPLRSCEGCIEDAIDIMIEYFNK